MRTVLRQMAETAFIIASVPAFLCLVGAYWVAANWPRRSS